MCHENEMGAAKEQHPYIICRLDKQRRWNSGGTVTRPLFNMVRYYLLQWNHILSLYNTWCEEASRKSGTLSPSSFLLVFSY